MKDPRPLSEEAETSELVQSLLAAGRARREPEGARERVWAALGVGMAGGVATVATTEVAAAGAKATAGLASGASAANGAAATAGAAGGAGGAVAKGAGIALALTKVKLLAIGGVLTAAGVAAIAVQREAPPPSTLAVAPGAPASAASPHHPPVAQPTTAEAVPNEAVPAEAPVSEPSKPATSAIANGAQGHARLPVQTAAVKNVASAGTLGEEAALLHDVRTALTRGDHDLARTKLDEARARFPVSRLAPERDALEVRVASESGDRYEAARLARAFIERYPDSALRPGIESVARATEKE